MSAGASERALPMERGAIEAAPPLKVGLYLQNEGPGLGGSEYWLAFLAEDLSRRHDVSMLHHRPGMTRERLAEFTGRNLSRVTACEDLSDYSAAAYIGDSVASEKSAAFDLFVTMTHRVPPTCRAPVGFLIVLFPFEPEPNQRLWPWNEPANWSASPTVVARRAYHAWRWRRRFDSYQVRTSLSTFTQEWVRRGWGVETSVMYPPNDTSFEGGPKNDVIVSIGRFSAGSVVSKNQLELVRLFRTQVAPMAPGWSYTTIGAVDAGSADDLAYLQRVKEEALGCAVEVVPNANRPLLKDILGRARIFWHGIGFDIDEQREPHRCEHFGLVTVEAMATGAVPVVIGRGGQKEIVRHEIDGFLCNTLEEVASRTRWLIDHPDELAKMSTAARDRARDFSVEHSLGRFRALSSQRLGIAV